MLRKSGNFCSQQHQLVHLDISRLCEVPLVPTMVDCVMHRLKVQVGAQLSLTLVPFFACPHFEKNNEAVDHNNTGKNNENGETDETDNVAENAIDSQNVALQIVFLEIVHFLESALN